MNVSAAKRLFLMAQKSCKISHYMVAEFSLEEGGPCFVCLCAKQSVVYSHRTAAVGAAVAINFPSFGELPLKKVPINSIDRHAEKATANTLLQCDQIIFLRISTAGILHYSIKLSTKNIYVLAFSRNAVALHSSRKK